MPVYDQSDDHKPDRHHHGDYELNAADRAPVAG